MVTTNTILSQKDLSLLENVIIKFGRIVSFDQIQDVAGETYSRAQLRNRIALLAKKGWLLRLKKGFYLVITNISTLGFNDVSEYIIAQALNTNSYISFENALQYCSMFDQGLSTVNSVTTSRARTYAVGERTRYRFSHIEESLYFGFTQVFINGKNINMAEKEKALLDLLYFRHTSMTMDIVLEKLRDYKHSLDFQKLKEYAKRYSLSMVREIGFLLDQIDVNTADLYTARIKENSYSKISREAQTFNAKWRLYYDNRFITA